MTETELNRLRAKLRRLDLNEAAINSCLHQFEADLETYASASRVIDSWERPDPSQTVLQALACGLIAAVLGGWFAFVS
tara:strand:+ start:109 stop:342 length:234 start_codon:yes stop_codon:yes gene_type:complete